MRRSFVKTTMGDNRSKVVVRYESEFCEAGSIRSRQEQMRVLRTLTDTPDLQMCGFWPFQTMRVSHNGEVWVVELEAIGTE